MQTATAIPAITTQFHSIPDIGWYTGAYLLPIMALQPSFGKIYTFFSIKYVLLCALLLFETGSLISASLAKFSRLHSWKSSEWHWRCGYFWRRKYVNVFFLTLKIWTSSISLIFCSDLNSACRPTSPRCTLHEHHVKHVWCRRSDWAPCRRCLHQQCTIDLAGLLLYKSTYDLTM